MPSSSKTPYAGLNLWGPDDRPKWPELTEDNRNTENKLQEHKTAIDGLAGGFHAPYTGEDGYWYEWDVATAQYVKKVYAGGTGLEILGTYATVEALELAVTTASQGDMYNVGATAPYTIYMWDTTVSPAGFISQGQIKGQDGVPGPNEITTATATPISGVLVGKDGYVKEGEAGEDFAAAAHAAQHAANGADPITPASIGAAAALQANTTVYVSPSGSDSTGDGSETNPYATVSAALASAPKILNGRILIIRVSAGTYPGFNLNRFGNGKVLLYLDGVSFSGAVDLYENTAPIEIFGNFSISADQASAAAFTITTTLCRCHGNLTCTNTSQVSPRSLRVIYGASFIMETGNLELLVSGSAAIGLLCSFSEVFLNTVSGNATTGFYANGGVVRITSSTLETSTKVLKLSGGEVKTGAGIDLT